jgi:hypothetical protein
MSRLEQIVGSYDSERFRLVEIAGRVLFPIYAMSGGIAAKQICYFRGELAPAFCGGDLGRESNPPEGIVPIEFDADWDERKCENKLRVKLGKKKEGE